MLSMLTMNIESRNGHHHGHGHNHHHHHGHHQQHQSPFQFLGNNSSHGQTMSADLKLPTTNHSATGTVTTTPQFSPRNHSPAINHKTVTTGTPTVATVTTSASSPSSNSSGSSVGTPHGIQDILSRPTSFGPGVTPNSAAVSVSAALGTALATGALPRFSLAGAAAVAASQGMYFNAAAAANSNLHKLAAGLGDLSSRHLYWPQMVQNQALWRERFSGSGKVTFFDTLEFDLN